ncbi:metallophosphoesterase [Sporosarcina sp. FSL K6-1522]|uniref:metallophosphoesterase n=1 Tax=Sporosarcina sp. FSL K6-1522 TaxID=2921554 RepID=UPI00315AA68B
MVTIMKKIAWTVLSALMGTVMLMWMNARKKNVVFHEVHCGLGDTTDKQLTIFFISDIHRRVIDDKLLSKVHPARNIDSVIIGGDLAERGVPLSRVEENVRRLACLGPLFYVWGNNDREVGEEAIRAIITRHGGVILDNTNATIPGHPTWGICGTDDPSSRKVDIDSTLRYIEQYENVILVTHTPSLFRKIEPLYHPRLMLAGHTHGGQIRIGKFGLMEKGAFKSEGGKAKLVSNGYGTSTLPLRLGAMPESHVITMNYVESVRKGC